MRYVDATFVLDVVSEYGGYGLLQSRVVNRSVIILAGPDQFQQSLEINVTGTQLSDKRSHILVEQA